MVWKIGFLITRVDNDRSSKSLKSIEIGSLETLILVETGMGLGAILVDFSGWTSAHGIPHVGSANNLCLRLFWAIVFLGSTGMFIFQMVLLVDKYTSYDVTVQTEVTFLMKKYLHSIPFEL